jgi:hypothetical protein
VWWLIPVVSSGMGNNYLQKALRFCLPATAISSLAWFRYLFITRIST